MNYEVCFYNLYNSLYDEKPLRILVSSRNWDDGEWAGVVTWNSEHECFVISKGFYNRERKTISVQNNKKCDADNAAATDVRAPDFRVKVRRYDALRGWQDGARLQGGDGRRQNAGDGGN